MNYINPSEIIRIIILITENRNLTFLYNTERINEINKKGFFNNFKFQMWKDRAGNFITINDIRILFRKDSFVKLTNHSIKSNNLIIFRMLWIPILYNINPRIKWFFLLYSYNY